MKELLLTLPLMLGITQTFASSADETTHEETFSTPTSRRTLDTMVGRNYVVDRETAEAIEQQLIQKEQEQEKLKLLGMANKMRETAIETASASFPDKTKIGENGQDLYNWMQGNSEEIFETTDEWAALSRLCPVHEKINLLLFNALGDERFRKASFQAYAELKRVLDEGKALGVYNLSEFAEICENFLLRMFMEGYNF